MPGEPPGLVDDTAVTAPGDDDARMPGPTPAVVPPSAESPRFPERLGPYVLEERLGRGALGEVFAATHTETGARVAVKLLFDRAPRERVQPALRALRRLTHPGLARLFDWGSASEPDGALYLVQEYLVGESLRQRLQRLGRLAPEETITLGQKIAEALAVAHEAGVQHHDLKPENVMLTAELDGERAVLLDLGLAPLLCQEGAASGLVLGTAQYLAPEQCEAGRALGPEVDAYALGVLLYEMLSGAPPFRGNVLQLMRQHVESVVPSLSDRAPQTPRLLCRLVHDLLAKTPAARPSLVEVADRLQALPRLLAEEARRRLELPAPPAPRPTPPRPPVLLPTPETPHNPIFAWLALALVSACVGAALVQWLWQRGVRLSAHLEDSGTADSLTAIVGDGPVAYAVGRSGILLRNDGGDRGWTALQSGTREDLYAVAARAGVVYAAGERGTLLVYSQGRAALLRSGTEERLDGLWLAPNTLWAVGQRGVVLRAPLLLDPVQSARDGAAVALRSGVSLHLRAVHGRAEDDVWIVGGEDQRGVALRYDGTGLRVMYLPEPLRGVFVAGPREVFVVGGTQEGPGVAYRFGRQGFWRLPVPAVQGTWIAGVSGPWLVTDNGLVLHRDPSGAFARLRPVDGSLSLRGVVAMDKDQALAVGSGGAVLRLSLRR